MGGGTEEGHRRDTAEIAPPLRTTVGPQAWLYCRVHIGVWRGGDLGSEFLGSDGLGGGVLKAQPLSLPLPYEEGRRRRDIGGIQEEGHRSDTGGGT